MDKMTIADIDKELEKLAKDYRAVPKLSNREKVSIMRRQEELVTMLVKLGDKGGRCSWCSMPIKGRHYKVRLINGTRLSKKEVIFDSCKRCFDEFKAWRERWAKGMVREKK